MSEEFFIRAFLWGFLGVLSSILILAGSVFSFHETLSASQHGTGWKAWRAFLTQRLDQRREARANRWFTTRNESLQSNRIIGLFVSFDSRAVYFHACESPPYVASTDVDIVSVGSVSFVAFNHFGYARSIKITGLEIPKLFEYLVTDQRISYFSL